MWVILLVIVFLVVYAARESFEQGTISVPIQSLPFGMRTNLMGTIPYNMLGLLPMG